MVVPSACRLLAVALLAVSAFSSVSGTPCPPEWRQSGAWCYLTNTSSTMSWAGAKAFCEERGGSLATIQNRSRLLDLTDILMGAMVAGATVPVGFQPVTPPAPTTVSEPPATDSTQPDASRFGRSASGLDDTDIFGLPRGYGRTPAGRHILLRRVSPNHRHILEQLLREEDLLFERVRRVSSPPNNGVTHDLRWWIGIQKTSGTTSIADRDDGAYDNFGEEKIIKTASSGESGSYQCVYMSSSDGLWYWTTCDSALRYVCQKEADRVHVELVTPERRRPDPAWLRAHEADLAARLVGGGASDDDKGVYSSSKATATPIPPPTTTTPLPPTPAAAGTTTPSPCSGDNWWMLTSRCHHLIIDAKSYSEAEQFCQAKGGHLTKFENEAAQATFRQHHNYNTGSIWIGLQRSGSRLQWWDGSSPDYTSWAAGQPVFDQSCVTLNLVTNKWSTAECDTPKSFSCCREVDATEQPIDVTTAPEPEESPCGGGGWWPRDSDCLLLVSNTPASWYAAEHDCRNQTATLVKINNDQINQHVLGKLSGVSIWIGLSKMNAARTFQWSDGSALGYSNWVGGTNASHETGSCALLDVGQGKWRTVNCNAPLPYMCRRPVSSGPPPLPPPIPPPPRSTCPQAWQPYGPDRCLRLFTHAMNWTEARRWCQDQADGGDLLSVPSAVYQAFLTSAVKLTMSNLWISLTYDELDRQRFLTWTDETPVNYTNWAPGQPSKPCVGCPKTCGVVDGRNTSSAAAWIDVDCSLTFGAVCQRPAMPNNSIVATQEFCNNTNSQYIAAAGACYRIIKEARPWHEAADFCHNDDSALAYVGDLFDNAELVKLLYRDGSPRYWLGLSDTTRHGMMEWIQPWPKQATFANWDPSHIRQSSRDSCAALLPATGLWQYRNCNVEQLPFVCQRAPQREAPAPAAGHCEADDDWVAGETRCYKAFGPQGVGLNWTQAKAECEQDGFQLATVSSVMDFRAVRSAIRTLSSRRSAWIGLRSLQGVEYKWTDGSPVTYRAWQRREPVKSTACVEASIVSNGRWMTMECSRQTAYVCMKEMSGTGTAVTGELSASGGGGSGWASFGVAVMVLTLLAGVAVLGVWVARRRRVRWLPVWLQVPRGSHLSADSLSYTRQSVTSSDEAADNGDLDVIATNRWGSQEQLVIRDN